MGGWKLEVARMSLYMMFPVGIFHWFNQPENFESWVTKVRREMYPPESQSHRAELQAAIDLIRERDELKMLEALESDHQQ